LDEAAEALAALKKSYPSAIPVYERFATVQGRRGDLEEAASTRQEARRIRRAGIIEQERYHEAAQRRIELFGAAGLDDASRLFIQVAADLNPSLGTRLRNASHSAP